MAVRRQPSTPVVGPHPPRAYRRGDGARPCSICGGPTSEPKGGHGHIRIRFCGSCRTSHRDLITRWRDDYFARYPGDAIIFSRKGPFTVIEGEGEDKEERHYEMYVTGATPDRDLGWRIRDIKTGRDVANGFASQEDARAYVRMRVNAGKSIWVRGKET